jgi:hypothetical protein
LSEQDKENRRQAITIREKTASSVVQEFISWIDRSNDCTQTKPIDFFPIYRAQ